MVAQEHYITLPYQNFLNNLNDSLLSIFACLSISLISDMANMICCKVMRTIHFIL